MNKLICPYCNKSQSLENELPSFWNYGDWKCESCEGIFRAKTEPSFHTRKKIVGWHSNE